MCRSVDFSVGCIDVNFDNSERFTDGSNGGALSTFSQLRDVMLLSHNNIFIESKTCVVLN